jgi:hypothetical protein
MPAGRPSTFKPEFAQIAFAMALVGAIDKDMALAFGTTEQNINLWKQRYPDFLESLKRGKLEADAKVGQRLYERAIGYSHESVKIFADAKTGAVVQVPYIEHYPPDTVAAIFWLKNRQPLYWRDKIEIEGNGIGSQTLVQINVIGGNGLPMKNITEGKVEIGKVLKSGRVIGKGKPAGSE